VKKLLIIQLDEAYFLLETCFLLNRYREALKDFQITCLFDEKSLSQLQDGSCELPQRIVTNAADISNQSFDMSVNFSLKDKSWDIHGDIKSQHKIGAYKKNNQLLVEDTWSAFLLTIKGGTPFLTFHLQDIYKNILGIKSVSITSIEKRSFNKIVFTLSNTNFFAATEQEKLIKLIHTHHPTIKILDISEIDPVSDLTHTLYVGPATSEALKVCENGATGVFLTSQFQGFNLLPHRGGHFVVSSNQEKLIANDLIRFIDRYIYDHDIADSFPFSAYQIKEEQVFGSYIESLNHSDNQYPIYQAHVVLWNFILNLYDVHLDVSECKLPQLELILSQREVLAKLIRLYDYAMSSVDSIYQESKSKDTNSSKLTENLRNLEDIEKITDQISQSHIFLRPILDFYRIRRGQNSGNTLTEQAQHSFLTYSEEHHALKALMELFTVTLTKNEASI